MNSSKEFAKVNMWLGRCFGFGWIILWDQSTQICMQFMMQQSFLTSHRLHTIMLKDIIPNTPTFICSDNHMSRITPNTIRYTYVHLLGCVSLVYTVTSNCITRWKVVETAIPVLTCQITWQYQYATICRSEKKDDHVVQTDQLIILHFSGQENMVSKMPNRNLSLGFNCKNKKPCSLLSKTGLNLRAKFYNLCYAFHCLLGYGVQSESNKEVRAKPLTYFAQWTCSTLHQLNVSC